MFVNKKQVNNLKKILKNTLIPFFSQLLILPDVRKQEEGKRLLEEISHNLTRDEINEYILPNILLMLNDKNN